jgi:hypothetical protein
MKRFLIGLIQFIGNLIVLAGLCAGVGYVIITCCPEVFR